MLDRVKQTLLVGKLFKMTNAGELVWERLGDPKLGDGEQIYSEGYSTVSGGLRFTMYQTRSRREDVRAKELQKQTLGYILDSLTADRVGWSHKRWTTITTLEVMNSHDEGVEMIVDIDEMPLLRALFNSARRSVTTIDADIEAFIGKEENHAERHHG